MMVLPRQAGVACHGRTISEFATAISVHKLNRSLFQQAARFIEPRLYRPLGDRFDTAFAQDFGKFCREYFRI